MKKYEIQKVGDVEVNFDVSMLIKEEVLYINATQIAKQFNKKPIDWLKTEDTKEYIDAVSQSDNIHLEDLVKTQRGGRFPGTWIHNSLAIAFARWLSAKFAVACDKKIRELILEEQSRKVSRQIARLESPEMTKAIQESHENPKGYHYSNENDMINKIVIGMSAKKFKEQNEVDNVRDAMTALEVDAVAYLQKKNTTLIEIDMTYDERKNKLKYLFKKNYIDIE